MKFLSSEKLSQHKYKTPEGYLICTDAILSRTGKQDYRRNEVFADADDDSIIQIDRTEDEVFSPQTLASFENKPICIEHPDCDVTVDNHNDLAVGFVRDVRRANVQGNDVMVGNLVITDAKAIELIESGEMTDLSCGYDCDIVDEENPCQRNIRGNHVALCEQGRAGIAHIVDSAMKDKKTLRTNVAEIHAFKQGSKYSTFCWNKNNLSYSEIQTIANRYGVKIVPDKYDYVQIISEDKNKIYKAFGKINPGYPEGTWKIIDASAMKDVKTPNAFYTQRRGTIYVYIDYVLAGKFSSRQDAIDAGYDLDKSIRFNANYETDETNETEDSLVQSSSKEAFKKNIATEIESGKDPKQAAAIAYSVQRKNDAVKDEQIDYRGASIINTIGRITNENEITNRNIKVIVSFGRNISSSYDRWFDTVKEAKQYVDELYSKHIIKDSKLKTYEVYRDNQHVELVKASSLNDAVNKIINKQ